MKKAYTSPTLVRYGDVAALTGTLGDPFSGDTSFDLDGNALEVGQNCIHQCPTRDNVSCSYDE